MKQNSIEDAGKCCGIVGDSPAMQKLFRLISDVGKDDISSVLIHGESGVGKELVAKAIHMHSPRSCKNYVPVNCAAIPEALLESELFGYEKNAFTGATKRKIGRFAYAHQGTIFLDEIGEMPLPMQTKLLRLLQDHEVSPVGATTSTKVNVRVVAATNIDLWEAVQNKNFRADLYYRLNVIPVYIPPLRERISDISTLIKYFTKKHERNNKCISFTDKAIKALKSFPWPGNIRQLENMVQHLSILHQKDVVDAHDLPSYIYEGINERDLEMNEDIDMSSDEVKEAFNNDKSINFKEYVNKIEENLIMQALTKTHGNKRRAAQLLQMNRTTLIEKIKKKGLSFHEEGYAGQY